MVPLYTSKTAHNSASYKECFGTIYSGLLLNTDVPWVHNIEAVIHETSHNKFYLIYNFDKVILNDFSTIYYSPYRPDPRHLLGILLGLHAFVPTIYFVTLGYIKQIIPSSMLNKLYLYHLKNKLAYKVLNKYGKFTDIGNEMMRNLKKTIILSDSLINKNNIVSLVDVSLVKAQLREHLKGVLNISPFLRY